MKGTSISGLVGGAGRPELGGRSLPSKSSVGVGGLYPGSDGATTGGSGVRDGGSYDGAS